LVFPHRRVNHLPVKELVKTFIRTYAWRGGSHQSSPWVVKEDLVKKYNLTNKIADIFLSPSKVKEQLEVDEYLQLCVSIL